jgi:GH24 family phage-related lysozyme (muramidase)
MTPEVEAQVRAFLTANEGCVAYWYNDTSPSDPHGVTTIGRGNAFPHRPGEDQLGPGTAAAWDILRTLPRGMAAGWYALHVSWRADQGLLDELFDAELERFEADLIRQFPDMSEWPSAATAAAFDVAWQDGDDLADHWPHLAACLRACDWRGASTQCATSLTAGGSSARNEARARLFVSCVPSP